MLRGETKQWELQADHSFFSLHKLDITVSYRERNRRREGGRERRKEGKREEQRERWKRGVEGGRESEGEIKPIRDRNC